MIVALTMVAGLAAAAASVEVRRWRAVERVAARLDRPAARRPAPDALRRAVDRAGIDADPRTLLDLWVCTVLVTIATTPIVSGAPIALVVVVAGPPMALALARNRADRLRTSQIPLALDAAASALRGGASLPTAIDEASTLGGPLGTELEIVARRCRDGLDVRTAVGDWADAGGPDTALAGASLTMAASVGGPAADALESAAASLRQRAAAKDEVAALSVQARLSAGVLSAAPVAFTFLLATVDPASAAFLLRTPAGWACIAVGATLDAAGALWMHRLVRSAT